MSNIPKVIAIIHNLLLMVATYWNTRLKVRRTNRRLRRAKLSHNMEFPVLISGILILVSLILIGFMLVLSTLPIGLV